MGKLIKYSDFCQRFYKDRKSRLKNVSSKKLAARFFFTILLDDVCDDDSYMGKIYDGKYPADKYLRDMESRFDERIVFEVLENNIKNYVDLANSFDINVNDESKLDKTAFIKAITVQLKKLVEGNGRTEDIVADKYREYISLEFPNYIEKIKEKYSKIHTLLYMDEQQPFYDFFICNRIQVRDVRSRPLENANLEKLMDVSPYIVLVGVGGIGKSMMMNHLLLDSLEKVNKTKKIPVLVRLREFGVDYNDIVEQVCSTVSSFDKNVKKEKILSLLEGGRCQILLDGLDEIKEIHIAKFLYQIDKMIDMYTNCQYVISSRGFGGYNAIPRFRIVRMLPFSKEEALSLIDKLVYCPDDPKIKEKFRTMMSEKLFHTHREFAENPLLLTLMLKNFRYFADVPERRDRFYSQAYQTLLRGHDNIKPGTFSREFHSVIDPDDFTSVFSEFCAKSYRKSVYVFDNHTMADFFAKINAVHKLDKNKMKLNNFIHDACYSTCIMYEEGEQYHFIHRSFQEFFFAEYYSRQNDRVLEKLGRKFAERHVNRFDNTYALDMLFDITPDRVTQSIIFPFLKNIFEKEDSLSYWLFLKKYFGAYEYVCLNEEAYRQCGTNKNDFLIRHSYVIDSRETMLVLFDLINRKVLKIGPLRDLIRSQPEPKQELLYAKTFRFTQGRYISRHTDALGKFSSSDLVCDEEGKPVVFREIYRFDFDLALSEPDKYQDIVELFKDKNCRAYKRYTEVKKYYEKIKEEFCGNENDEEDDDF